MKCDENQNWMSARNYQKIVPKQIAIRKYHYERVHRITRTNRKPQKNTSELYPHGNCLLVISGS